MVLAASARAGGCGSAPPNQGSVPFWRLCAEDACFGKLARGESLSQRFLFRFWRFDKGCLLSGSSAGAEGREEAGCGGTEEKSSWKLRPIMLMSRTRAADPEGLYRPPCSVFNLILCSVFDVHRLKPLQVTVLRRRDTWLSSR